MSMRQVIMSLKEQLQQKKRMRGIYNADEQNVNSLMAAGNSKAYAGYKEKYEKSMESQRIIQ